MNPNRPGPVMADHRIFDPSTLHSRSLRLAVIVVLGSLALGCLTRPSQTQAGHERGAPVRLNSPPAHILVDQFGYRPSDAKVAVLRSPVDGYDAGQVFEPGDSLELRRAADHAIVFSAPAQPWREGRVQASSGDRGWWFDFSAISEPGRYYVHDPKTGERSAPFRIDAQVYDDVLETAVRMLYYQRSAFPKRAPHAARCWRDEAAYVGPRQDRAARDIARRDDPASARDLAGGWFDAGDTNLYVTFAGDALHQLLLAFQHYPAAFSDDYNIPESGNGIPDLVDEMRWQLEWLKKMQLEDGRSLLKLGTLKHREASPPSSDRLPRYYVGPCTSATISLAGMFAHAALVLRDIPSLSVYADDLQARALRAFDAFRSADGLQTDCDDQTVRAGDADRSAKEQKGLAATAAIYLFALTGETRFEDYLRDNWSSLAPDDQPGWSLYKPQMGQAMLFYSQLEQADPALAERALADKQADARGDSGYYLPIGGDLYRSFMKDRAYHWGSNAVRARTVGSNLDVIRYGLDDSRPDAYRERALGGLHYLHGVNPLGIVYLSNMYEQGATHSANEIYHVWFPPGTRFSNARKSQCGPAPGYLTGGPNRRAVENGVPESLRPPAGQPPQKAYRDWNGRWPDPSYPITEPSNSYQASYIYALAAFVNRTRTE